SCGYAFIQLRNLRPRVRDDGKCSGAARPGENRIRRVYGQREVRNPAAGSQCAAIARSTDHKAQSDPEDKRRAPVQRFTAFSHRRESKPDLLFEIDPELRGHGFDNRQSRLVSRAERMDAARPGPAQPAARRKLRCRGPVERRAVHLERAAQLRGAAARLASGTYLSPDPPTVTRRTGA